MTVNSNNRRAKRGLCTLWRDLCPNKKVIVCILRPSSQYILAINSCSSSSSSPALASRVRIALTSNTTCSTITWLTRITSYSSTLQYFSGGTRWVNLRCQPQPIGPAQLNNLPCQAIQASAQPRFRIVCRPAPQKISRMQFMKQEMIVKKEVNKKE